MSNFLQGKKTYIGIIIIVAGWLGIGDIVTADNISPIVDAIIQLVGIIIAIYGRYVAKPKSDY